MVDVIGRAKVVVETAVDKSSLDTSAGKIGSVLKTGALAGVAAVGTLAVVGIKAAKAFEEAEAQSRKLHQVLDNMGRSDAAPAVERLADQLSRTTGIEDELIKQGQTLLGTFSEVAESAGVAGGTFERATRAAVDLAAAGFGSVESSSVQLGKALQNPVKGLASLSKAGVTFTEEQKALIEGFVQANDVASAQEIILGEVEKQVKGTAEASAQESVKIQTAMGEIQEAIGHALGELTAGEVNKVSDALFRLSDLINELAESDDWQAYGKDLRSVASDLGKVAKFGLEVYNINRKLAKEVPGLAGAWRAQLAPLAVLSDAVELLSAAYEELYGWKTKVNRLFGGRVTGDDVPDAPDVSQPRSTRAHGGPAAGLTLVGERGPELLRLPAGSYVHNNGDTERMLAAAGRHSEVTNLNFYGPTSLSQARREADWARTYGTRFGTAAGAGAL